MAFNSYSRASNTATTSATTTTTTTTATTDFGLSFPSTTTSVTSIPLNLTPNCYPPTIQTHEVSINSLGCSDPAFSVKLSQSERKIKSTRGLFNSAPARNITTSAIDGFNFSLRFTESLLRNHPTVPNSPIPLIPLRNPASTLQLHLRERSNKCIGELVYPHRCSCNSIVAQQEKDKHPHVIFQSNSLQLDNDLVSNTRFFTTSNWLLSGKSSESSLRPSKMHQTSSRLLRMTNDDRPFTRDFKDLFATLIVSLPLAPHRIRLTRIEHSFLSEEAINNLGSLKFSQSNRMPDPKDPSRIVTTTTTTTFSMSREMARSVCQRFLDARFIESADGKHSKDFPMKGALWQLTPKGVFVLERFCGKNGIQQKHVTELINSARNTMQLVILERDPGSDKLSSDRSTIEVIFRRFVGQNGPNLKSNTTASSSDSDSLSEYKDSISGVRMTSERRIGSRMFTMTFTGRATTDWLMECCTTVDRLEATEIATSFLTHGLMTCVHVDRQYLAQFGGSKKEITSIFQPTKNAIYQLTSKGKDVVEMKTRDYSNQGELSGSTSKAGACRDSNTQKLEKILSDAALRLLFRENLRETHCEENLSFYLDVDEFIRTCQQVTRSHSKSSKSEKTSLNLDSVKETMASAYGIYNAFLAPGSPNELNIDHMLRNQLATRMTKAIGQNSAMIESLEEVTKLFQEAQKSVFKLMASDSIPKFMKSPKYEQTLKNYDFDTIQLKSQHELNTIKNR
ncbi:Regulator of G-protein signaling [Erysiphe pulchra]|uniref:Regulator of G-protein signaling n=1 Tax=Erysiphe pulchra TaxID=225359 RepID=A0A2S4PUS3_9PEZI|nr:Regulator of G-protein signaling [Erysiphe pulchra]